LATNQFQGAGNQPRSIDNPPTQTVKSTQKSENVQRVAGEEMETKREAAFQPTRVTFSVGIPKTYFEDLWRKQYAVTNPEATDGTPTVPANELAKLEMTIQDEMQKALAPLLPPVEAGADKYPLVEVWAYDELPVAPASKAGVAEQALTWLADSWQALALLGLALCALWVARSVGRSVGAPRPEFEEGFGLELPKPPEEEEEDVLENSGGPMLEITGLTLQRDLHRLVENNPEAAANVLRNWLEGEAA
jgi:flagellar M-ring protein FliF